MKPQDMIDPADDLDLTTSDVVDATTALYTLLIKYTSGTVRRNIRLSKAKWLFEQDRRFYVKGMRLAPKNLFHQKAKVWKVAEATWEGTEDAIEEWEAKLEFLNEH